MFQVVIPSIIFLFLAAFAGENAYGEGAISGGGGGTVVCFKIPLEKSVNGGKITKVGQGNIESAVTFEYYRISKLSKRGKWLSDLENRNPSYEDALEALESKLRLVPRLLTETRAVRKEFGLVQDGEEYAGGIKFVPDAGVFMEFEENCTYVQAVYRQGSDLNYYPAVWNALSPLQKALLQVHEEIYRVSGKPTSIPTQQLMMALYGQELTGDALVKKLKSLEFGTYRLAMDPAGLEKDKKAVLASINAMIDAWEMRSTSCKQCVACGQKNLNLSSGPFFQRIKTEQEKLAPIVQHLVSTDGESYELGSFAMVAANELLYVNMSIATNTGGCSFPQSHRKELLELRDSVEHLEFAIPPAFPKN